MLQKLLRVILQKFPPELETQHSLLLCVDENIFDTVGFKKSFTAGDSSSFIGALMRNYPLLHEPLDCKFFQINILHSAKADNDAYAISLYISEKILQDYNYDYNDVCYLKPVDCYPLEKVLFGAKTAESFNLFQDKEFSSALLKQIEQENILCHQGYAPLLSCKGCSNSDSLNLTDLLTLDCQPFRKGLLTLKSSIILSNICDVADHSENLTTVDSTVDKSFVVNFDVISYMRGGSNSRLNYPAIPSLPPNLPIKFSNFFNIEILPLVSIDFERELRNVNGEIDTLNTVFMPYGTEKRLKVKNGSWVKISLISEKKDDLKQLVSKGKDSALPVSKNVRLAQVCIFSNEALSSKHFHSHDRVYISPLLWFNLNHHPSCLVQKEVKLLVGPLEESPPPYANEVYASLIQCPNYDGKVLCDTMLKKYFSVPRFICKGDIISLNTKDQLDYHVRISDEDVDKLKWPVVHFCISRVDGHPTPYGYLCKNTETRLYESGTKQRYVPNTMETFYRLTSYHPLWSTISNGLYQYINELQNLILPFLKLKGKNQITCNILFTGPPCCGKTTVVKAVCRCLNLHLYKVNCYDFVGETSAVIESRLKGKIAKGSSYAPCIILLKNIHSIGKEKENVPEDSRVIHALASILQDLNSVTSDWPILVIGTALDPKQLSNNLVSAFLHSVQMMAPTEEERCYILDDLLTACDVGNDVSISYIAQRTAGFVLGDLCALINQAIRNAYNRMETMVTDQNLKASNEEDIILASVPVVQRDLLNALEKLQSEYADAIGAPKIPNVKFEDVGGLANVKQEILDTIQLPLEHPEILLTGLRRSGVLLYGPPGSGKTLLAKAVATECSLNFLSVKGPELINMYVGQSEENVRAVFNQARSAVPCIIFFDELDSLAPNRGRSGDSGGVMDRVVSQLLAELDGLNKKSEVFVIGATNRPDLLDPALLRPGRFDRLLYVGIPEEKKSKLSILKALTRKFPLAADVNLEEIVDKCPPHLSGADFYSLCSNAVIQRVEKNVEVLEKGDKKIEDINCEVTTEDFLAAMETLVPSVSPDQYKQYQAIKAKIESK